MFARAVGEYEAFPTDFTTETRPSVSQVGLMIGLAVAQISGRVGYNLAPQFHSSARFMTTLYTALLLEPGYWPEQQRPDKSAWEQWKLLYDEGMPTLITAIKEAGAGEEVGPDDDKLAPIWAFPVAPIYKW